METETDIKPLIGKELLQKLKEIPQLSRSAKARECGYVSVVKSGSARVNISAFLNAILEAKGVSINSDSDEDEGDCSELDWQDQSQSSEAEEESIWRGVFTPHHSPKILFSKDVEIEVRSLPTWKPRVVIERYRLDDDE
jgi:hypothetical protein